FSCLNLSSQLGLQACHNYTQPTHLRGLKTSLKKYILLISFILITWWNDNSFDNPRTGRAWSYRVEEEQRAARVRMGSHTSWSQHPPGYFHEERMVAALVTHGTRLDPRSSQISGP
ncbi:hypothetical protein H1C71_022136, partial [Ictidomys tridecemlineatus]